MAAMTSYPLSLTPPRYRPTGIFDKFVFDAITRRRERHLRDFLLKEGLLTGVSTVTRRQKDVAETTYRTVQGRYGGLVV